MPLDLEARVVRKITWRILPFVMLLYFVRTLCAWALVASDSSPVWIFAARSWLDQHRAQRGGDPRHDRLGTSFRPNTGADMACSPSMSYRVHWICLGRHHAKQWLAYCLRWC